MGSWAEWTLQLGILATEQHCYHSCQLSLFQRDSPTILRAVPPKNAGFLLLSLQRTSAVMTIYGNVLTLYPTFDPQIPLFYRCVPTLGFGRLATTCYCKCVSFGVAKALGSYLAPSRSLLFTCKSMGCTQSFQRSHFPQNGVLLTLQLRTAAVSWSCHGLWHDQSSID